MVKQRMCFQFLRTAGLCSVVAVSSLSCSAYALPNTLPNAPLTGQVFVSSLEEKEREEEESTDTALAREAHLAEALSITERIERVDDKALALAAIAQTYARQGDLNRANELLSQALQLAKQSTEPENSHKRLKVLNTIADGYIATGKEATAADVLLQSLELVSVLRSNTQSYRYFIEAVEHYGEFSEAALTQPGLEKALALSNNATRDGFSQSYALGKIAIAYSQLNDAAIAEAGISTLSNLLLTPDETASPRLQQINRDSALIDIAEAHARYGDSAAAIAHLESVSGLDSFYNLSKIAAVYGLLDDTAMAKSALDELVAVINSLPEPDNRSTTNNRLQAINNIAIAYIETGSPEAAHRFLTSTVPNLSTSDNPNSLFFLSQFANTYELIGDTSTQQALLQQAFELFAPNDLPKPNQLSAWQALGFETMAQNYAQLSAEAAPEQLAHLLQIATDNDWNYSYPMYLAMLLQAASQKGDSALMQQLHTKALDLLAMDDNGVPRNDSNMMMSTLITLANVYGQTSQTSVAIEGLASLTQVADSLATSSEAPNFQQQELLSGIAIAYASLM